MSYQNSLFGSPAPVSRRSTPTMQELDCIAAGRMQVERLAPHLRDGQAIYLARNVVDTMNRWPHDTRLVGFTGRDDGWYWQGTPVKAAP